ncbi:AraC family transcriptional regulator [Pararhodobacter marinus]|uniref:AraC family transcriptional regulator n=1 Tax=Pararhodobacter marinus TaxID=2184063 RepID=UPI003511C166
MSQPMMAAGFVAAFVDYAVTRGATRDALLRAGGLGAAQLAAQDARVPVSAYCAVITAAMAQTGDTALLLRQTLDTRLEEMSVVGQIVHHSASLEHSIAQLNRYLRLIADTNAMAGRDRFEIRRSGSDVWILDHLPVADADYLMMEASFARFISEFRRAFPDKVFALALDVSWPPPPHAAAYPELLQIPVRFGAGRNALRIDPVWLTPRTAFEPGNPYVFGIFARHADALLAELSQADTIRARIEARLLPDLHKGAPSMDRLARDLGMSRQTLYRRLKDEGVTFAGLHDALRHRMAVDYLRARKVSVNETAYLLGFSEASSFVRAFRRWTGRSPTAFLGAD